ncbi:uncharacterized protein LOC100575111 [Acyrthosiphon pisum]|uniref:Uncharacterized protein n=1 Tax=Acyrthosiphon pisum TaxID=7029 RepID=A0A8R2F8Y5_ACYPI|nr:uncharacterized protein LOC100575111 [Acyrthosiphon pisum]|eukprot:XP_008183745.1 PREDICTED: uncharacterized protein LOC100575111 [Acyrthosiphon pisum]
MNTRTDCSPRIIKRISSKEKTGDASKYGFYRHINHLSIIRLDNEADKLNYSSWLTRLDNETSDLKMHLIKILFISLRSEKSFQIFLKPPPDDLKDLELRSDNTMDMVKWLQDNNIPDESPPKENKQEILHRRSAAVATNMRSYTTIKTSPYFVQSFYVRSDWPIYTWYNPTSIGLPSNHDHNQWELFLNRFQIVTEDKNANNKHRNECDDIIPIDQVAKELANTFNWHPYSILINEETRPKQTAGSIAIDKDVGNQLCNQQQIDDAAFAIVSCKIFPGNKILSQRMYSDTLIPDRKFVFQMTGVTMIDYSSLKLKNDETLPFICKLKERKQAIKNRCGVKEKTPCPCEKPMMVVDCSKPKSPCSTTAAQNTKQINQTKKQSNTISIIHKNTCNVKTESDSKFSNLNITYQECKSSSKCLKRSVKKSKSVESCKFPKEADLNVDDNNESKDHTNCPKVLNAGKSSFNDSSNCDWTVSSVEITMTEPERACSSTPPNCKANNCTLISPDQVARVEPEDQSARKCSGVQKTPPPAAAKTPNCSANICTLTAPDQVARVEPEDQGARNCSGVQKTPPPAAAKAPNCSADICTSLLPDPVEPKDQSTRNCSSVQKTQPPPVAAKTPNCNANICPSMLTHQVMRVEPEDQSARNSSGVQKTTPPAVTTPRQCPRTTEGVREPQPQENCRQRSLGIRDGTSSEPTENGGRADPVCSGGCRRKSAPEPRDRCASARGPTADDGRKAGQCPGKDQNRTCQAAFAEHRPKTPMENGGRRRTPPGRRMSAPQPRDTCASARGPTTDDGRRVGQCPGKDMNRSCQPAFSEYRTKTPMGPGTPAVSGSDRSASQQQQQQHDRAGSRSDDRSNTAAADLSWNPEVSSYSAFSNSHVMEDRFRFLTSERMVDDRPAAMRSPPSSPLLPANDFHSAAAAAAANYDNDLSDDSFGARSDWSAEQGCPSGVRPTNRFDDDNNNNNYYYSSSSSLSTLTSSDSSIDMRIAARRPLSRNVNYDRRTERLMSTNSSDRYPFNSSLSPNLADVGLRRASPVVADVWPPARELVEDVSMPGNLVTGPWSLSMSDSRSGRYLESSDVGAADQYHNNSCSEGGNASGRDDYGGSETDDGDDDAGAASTSRRNY